MKKNKSIINFIFDELPNLIQIFSLPALISVVSQENALAIPLLSIFGAITALYLDNHGRRYFAVNELPAWWSFKIILFSSLLLILVIFAYLTSAYGLNIRSN